MPELSTSGFHRPGGGGSEVGGGLFVIVHGGKIFSSPSLTRLEASARGCALPFRVHELVHACRRAARTQDTSGERYVSVRESKGNAIRRKRPRHA